MIEPQEPDVHLLRDARDPDSAIKIDVHSLPRGKLDHPNTAVAVPRGQGDALPDQCEVRFMNKRARGASRSSRLSEGKDSSNTFSRRRVI